MRSSNPSLWSKIVPADERVFVFASLAAIVLVCLGWAHPGTVIAQGDRSPLLDPLNQAAKVATAWSNDVTYVGEANPYFGFAPYLVAYAAFVTVFGMSYGQVLCVALLLSLSWLGAFRCARAVGISPAMACVAAWAFALNPSRQGYVLILPTFDVMAALIPWLFYLLLNGASIEKRARATLWICLIAALYAAVLMPSAQLILEIVLGCLAWTVFAATFAADRRAYVAWALRTFALAAAVSLWWTVPAVIAYKSGEMTRVITLSENAWIFGRASLLNELRFVSSWAWRIPDYYPWAQLADRVAPLYVSTFLLPAGLIAGLLLARGRQLQAVRFCGGLALVMLFLSKGSHDPFAFINQAFFRIPGMFLFLESVGAITVAAICLALCLGIALDAVPASLGHVRLRPVVAGAASVAIAAGGLVIITGAVFHEPSGFEPSMHVRVPGDWRDLAEHINRSASSGGVLVLPADPSYQVDYTWGYYGSDGLARDLLHREVLVPGAPVGYVAPHAQLSIERKLTAMLSARSPLVVPMLRDLGVRYVIFRNDARMNSGFPFSASDVDDVFGKQLERRFGLLDLYDLGPPAGRVTAASDFIVDDAPAREPGDQVELRSLEERLPRIDRQAAQHISQVAHVAFMEAEPPDARAVDRFLWRESVGSGAGSTGALDAAELRASYAIDRTPNGRMVRSFRQLQYIPESDGLPVPHVVGHSLGERGLPQFDVVDPSACLMQVDLAVGVRSRRAAVFTLLVNGRKAAATRVPASNLPVWVRFSDVQLLPGDNYLVIEGSSYPFATYAVLLPPRRFTGGAFDPFEGQVVFSRIRVASRPATPLAARTFRGPGILTHVVMRGGATLMLQSDVGVPGRASEWVIGATLRGKHYQCYERFSLGLESDLGESLHGCFEALGIYLDNDDQTQLTITSLRLLHGVRTEGELAPFETLSLASRIEQPVLVDIATATRMVRFILPASQADIIVRKPLTGPMTVRITATASDVSNLAIGTPPSSAEANVPIAVHFGGLYIARVERPGVQLVMVRDVYHPTWFAISGVPHVRLLPHVEADGWRNAWLVEGPGWLIAFNALVLTQILLGVATLALLAWLLRVAR